MDVLAPLDLVIILLYILLAVGIGLFARQKTSQNFEGFFLGGQNTHWLIVGLSMVATTFAADTPLLVTGIVAKNGISGNWLWWNMMIGGMVTVFFFAKLWKRAGVRTELELLSLRYGDHLPTRLLKYMKSLYLGGLINALIMAWVNLAMFDIITTFFGYSDLHAYQILLGLLLLTVLYTNLSGLKGVMFTDAFQFLIAMGGCVLMAVILVNHTQIGGLQGLIEKIHPDKLNVFPEVYWPFGEYAQTPDIDIESLTLSFGTFFAFVGLQWWASWYPGAEPGGGGYIAQRMLSSKNEKNAQKSLLFFQIVHYCIRPWPWIVIALCTTIIYTDLAKPEQGFILAMKHFLPTGAKGLLIVAFLSAYMSTISTQLNWGMSLLTNDLIKPLNPAVGQNRLIRYGQLGQLILALVSLGLCTQLSSIEQAWKILIGAGAGLGLVLMLRWYVKRINVWSEISATCIPFFVYPVSLLYFLKTSDSDQAHTNSFYLTTCCTTIGWIIVTFLSPKTDSQILESFFERIHTGDSTTGRLILQLLSCLAAIAIGICTIFLFKSLLTLNVKYALICVSLLLLFVYSLLKLQKNTSTL